MEILPLMVKYNGKGNAVFLLPINFHKCASMKEKLQVLKQTELLGQQLTVYGTMEQPLFLAKDVAEWIEHSNTASMLQNIDADEKVINIVYTLGGEQSAWFLTEDGLYEVLMQSRKPIAKQFKKGVKNILREIRTTGGYLATSDTDTSEEILAKAVLVARKTIERKDQRIKQLEHDAASQAKQLTEQASTIKQQNKQIDELQSKAAYVDQILQSKSTVTTSQIAQDYGMSAKRFNQLLHDLKIQRKVNGQWILFAPYTERGYVHSETINLPVVANGVEYTKTVMHTKWLQSGRLFLYNMLKKNSILPLIER